MRILFAMAAAAVCLPIAAGAQAAGPTSPSGPDPANSSSYGSPPTTHRSTIGSTGTTLTRPAVGNRRMHGTRAHSSYSRHSGKTGAMTRGHMGTTPGSTGAMKPGATTTPETTPPTR